MSTLPPPQPLLPERARGDRPLFVIMGVMAFLAGLALLVAIWASRAGDIWTSGLEGRLTVQVVNAEQAEQAVAVVDALPGTSAQALDDAEVGALLEPWLGNAELPADIPVPALIEVNGRVSPQSLEAALASAGIEAEVDDHQRWANRVRGAAMWVRLGALAVLAVIFAAGAATSGFATEAALRAEETVIRVLGQVGAKDNFVARLFMSRFFFAGLKAAVAGALAAIAFGLIMGLVFGAPFGVGFGGLFWLMLLPLIFGGISAMAAGSMAMAQLRADRAAR